MSRYVLLRMPDGEIVIVDNSTHIGKKRVETYCNDGAAPAGIIESAYNPMTLREGIARKYVVERDDAFERLWKIKNFVDEI